MQAFRRTKKRLAALKAILAAHERYRDSYHWTAKGKPASMRRAEEFDDVHMFPTRDGEVQVRQSLDISCANYYYRMVVTLAGKRKDVRLLRALADGTRR